MRNIAESYAESPKFVRKMLWKIWHNYLISRDPEFEIKYMNYGYADLDNILDPLELKEEDKSENYCLNLYYQDIAGNNIRGKEVLEVGCGRGGGASFISRYFHPKTYIGLDLSKKAIKFCNSNYNVPGLSFVRGSADDLPFEDNSFDDVINVESSRCYADMDGFLSEVHRVLKPNGFLLFSDMRTVEGNELLKEQFKNAHLKIIVEKNILPNVLEALNLDNERRKHLILKKAPKFLQKSANEFSGLIGTERYRLFDDGIMNYYHYTLQKVE
ncbi:class I SAM-dependent methyltransferase [Promethearchaeum syntrophicum]|uniref:Class I SAM-dependent methyltransferase n=1 Tax=Promethearchaeum syntrophicum TaxID=2594042 RepID=A0A5B9D5Y9_9ARCH|nr:class I SAM-dependent methyltransferase [Candidatus Prometheoarchaeum syntrophicum]